MADELTADEIRPPSIAADLRAIAASVRASS